MASPTGLPVARARGITVLWVPFLAFVSQAKPTHQRTRMQAERPLGPAAKKPGEPANLREAPVPKPPEADATAAHPPKGDRS